MKIARKLVCLLLSLCMVFGYASAAGAVGGSPNVKVEVSSTSVNVGDEVTVTLSCVEHVVAGFGFYLEFDKSLLECTEVLGQDGDDYYYVLYLNSRGREAEAEAQVADTVADTNKDGIYSFGWVNGSDATIIEQDLITLTFVAKAAGTVTFVLNEQTSGTDAFKGIAATRTLTINADEPVHECADNNNDHNCDVCGDKLTDCADNNNDHDCDVCGAELSKCADNNSDHKCDVCGAELSKCADNNSDHKCDVCGTELSKCADNNKDHKCDVCGTELSKCSDKTGDQNHDCDVCGKPGITECADGTATCLNPAVCSECGQEHGKIDPENHVGEKTTTYIDNGDDHTVKVYYSECEHEISSTNEPHNYGDDFVCDDCGHELAGWVEKDGNWYYVENGKPVTGNVRVPYHKDYAPNAEDVAYANDNAESKYTDAETAVFVFDENGVFQSDFTGIIDGNRYAVDGVIAWHVGLVEIDGEYYYFIGDVNGGGNIAAEGDVYVSRFNGIPGFKAKEVYNFVNGKLSGLNGLVDRFNDGKLFYYENSKLMLGNGLTQFGEELIYVRSNGQIAIGKYWVAKTNGLCNPGMYTFGDDGFLQSSKNPNVNGLVDGVYYKDGMPYYAGLIEIDGDTYYINSAGEVVTGTYYVTKLDNYTGDLDVKRGDKLTFGTDGKLVIE